MQTIQLINGGQFEAEITLMGNARIPSINRWFSRSEFKLIVDEVTERNRALSKAWSAKIMSGREN